MPYFLFAPQLEPCYADGGFDVKTCRSKLAEYYKNSGTVPVSVWSTLDPVDIHEIYTRLSWAKQEQNAAGSSQTELDHYGDLFAANESGTFPKRILVQGQTGIGKTTFVKKLALDWAELNLEDETADDKKAVALKKFALLVAVNLKEVSKHQSLKDVISCSNIFAVEDKSITDGLLKYITDNQDKVLLVFDGYDEYRCGRDSDIFKIFKGDKLRDCCVLITSRISRADDLRESRVLKLLRAEIFGFSYSDISSYMKRKLGSDEDAENLFFHLRKNDLLALAKSPLLLLFLCILWKESHLENWPKTKTDLYVQIVQSVLYHNQAKYSASASCDFREVEDFEEILCEIGKVALECLFNDDHVFDYKQLPPSIFCEESYFIGLLQVTKHIGKRRPAGLVSFVHKSIQEFLSAWFITYRCVIPEGNLGPVEKYAHTLEGCIALENVFKFVCGLSDQGAAKVFTHFELVRMSDSSLDLTATVPDVEETDKPLSEVTMKHRTFFNLVWISFEEVQSKVELSRNCYDCVGGVFLDGNFPFELLQLKDCNSCTDWSIHFAFTFEISLDYLPHKLPSLLTLETLERLKNVNTEIPKMCDFVKRFLDCECDFISPYDSCGFTAILNYNSGKVRFFISDLQLGCFNHIKLFIEAGGVTNVTNFSTLRSGLFSLKFLTRVRVYDCFDNCNAEEPFAIIRNCGKSLNSIELPDINRTFDWMVRLQQEIPTLAEKCSWKMGSLDECNSDVTKCTPRFPSCELTPKGAEQLAFLLPHFRNTITLCLHLKRCSSSVAAKLVESITHEQLQHLVLDELTMTPNLAAALGRSLPKLTSLRLLELRGVTKQMSEEAVDVKLSFSLDKLENLYLGCFIMRKNFTTFIESLQFSPNLLELELRELNLNGNDVCSLLGSVSCYNPRLRTLGLQGNFLGDSVMCIIQYIRNLPSLRILWIDEEDCSEEGWRNLLHIQQAKSGLLINPWYFR